MNIVGKATISFSDNEVQSVNYTDGLPFVWIMLNDGMQINIPIGTVLCIADRAKKIEEYQETIWRHSRDKCQSKP